jgi:hypothetical protein
MIQDQGNGSGHHRQGSRDPGHDRGRRPGARCGQGPEDARVDRLDPIQRDREVGQQHRGIVVALVHREPTHPGALALGPLGQQGRFAVTGRSDHRDDRRGMRSQQPIQQRRAGHDPRAGQRRAQFRLHQLEGRPYPGPPVTFRTGSTLPDARIHPQTVVAAMFSHKQRGAQGQGPGWSQIHPLWVMPAHTKMSQSRTRTSERCR